MVFGWGGNIHFYFLQQQASKAIKLRNLGQRGRNMHAKAGEADRAIKVKMVSKCSALSQLYDADHACHSPNISLLASGRWAKQIADKLCIPTIFLPFPLLSSAIHLGVVAYDSSSLFIRIKDAEGHPRSGLSGFPQHKSRVRSLSLGGQTLRGVSTGASLLPQAQNNTGQQRSLAS